MELLAHSTASRQNETDHSPAPLEVTTEFGGDNVKENADDMNISSTARERLLKKLQGIRTTPQPLQPQRKLRGLRDEPVVTRFDEETVKEEDHLATSSASKRWKKLSSKVKEFVKKSQEEDSFQFFAGTFAVPEEQVEPVTEVTQPDETEDQLEDSALLKPSEESEAVVDQHQFDLLLPPKCILPEEPKEEETNNIVHYVSTVPVQQKPSTTLPLRFLEDEGFYVGDRPSVRYSNLSVMESRLLSRSVEGVFVKHTYNKVILEEAVQILFRSLADTTPGFLMNHKWFGEDGRLLMEPNPCFRPHSGARQMRDEQNECEVLYNKATNEYGMANSTADDFELGIDIVSMKFTHHHLFTKEHVVASRLQASCLEYVKREKEAIAAHLEDKLFALKTEYNQLKQQFEEENATATNLAQQYLSEIRHTRQLKNTEEAIDYALVKTIFRTWRELKAVREVQGYTCAPIELVVYRRDVDVVDDQTQWQRAIEEEVQEAREEFQYQVMNSERFEEETPSQNVQEATENDNISMEHSRATVRHRPSLEFDERSVRHHITTFYKQNKWKPGEARLIPKLNHCLISSEYPRDEQQRLEELTRLKYKVKILVNGGVVSETKERVLERPDFSVTYGEPFEIKMTHAPEIITFQVLECGIIKSTIISEVFVPIPDPSVTIANERTENYEFTSIIAVPPSFNAVGSGGTSDCLTTGIVTCKTYWINSNSTRYISHAIDSGALPLRSVLASEAVPILGEPGNADVDYLKIWLRDSKLDPNDPRNVALLEVTKDIAVQDDEYFRLNEVNSLLRFVSDDHFENIKRYKAFTHRQREHQYLKNKSIPLYDEGITREMWKAINDEQSTLDEFPTSDEGFREAKKQKQNKFYSELKKRMSSQMQQPTQQLNLSEIVHSDLIPNISWLKNSVTQFLSPKRPLKPNRQPKKNVISQTDHVEGATLFIRVVRANNLPTRKMREGQTTWSSSQVMDQTEDKVCPFIEVTLGDDVQKTSIANGPNPFWNEEISFSFNLFAPDYENESVQKAASQLQFNFFDEVIVNVKRDSEIRQKVYRRWLGNFWISVSTLYQDGKIEGNFKLNVPPMILGYNTQTQSSDEYGVFPSVYLLISLEPTLNQSRLLKKKLDSIEEPYLLQKAVGWQNTLQDKFPSRIFVTTGINCNGKTFFVIRAITPQNPPEQLWDQSSVINSMKRLARFVSLIPSLNDNFYLSEVWIPSDQFLDMLGSNQKERAVLLCNYFFHHNQEAWVVVGRGIPEGDTYYVLTKSLNGSTYWLWNPSTGEYYDQHDTNCPLFSIGCIFNARNIWANIQGHEKPPRMQLDISISGNWQALFTNKESATISTNQQTILHYYPTDPAIITKLQDRISFLLKKSFVSWRSRHITRWNNHCSQILQRILPMFEESKSVSLNQTAELREFNSRYKMNGFPFNVPYTSIADIISTVKNTEIYVNEDEDTEFALAVYIHNYPNDVISVWLYIATLKQLS